MKKIAFILVVNLLSLSLFAGNEQYTAAMKTAISDLEVAESEVELKAASASFERIAKVATDEWLPNYYLAYAHIQLSWKALETKDYSAYDLHMEAAEQAMEQAQGLNSAEAELHVLKAVWYQARIMRNPMVNGMRFSSSVDNALEKAKLLDPDNPRIYYVLGQQLYNMPTFVGGGKDKALVQFELAADKFTAFQTSSDLHPNWGKGMNDYMIENSK